ncbi:MAG: acyl-CoA/acyl-ACP dehydrogenase [Kurthia sp.]|nr:acyl-CoA/acyl-ACP dehydrogenase [Candidatus Kurthia equi]
MDTYIKTGKQQELIDKLDRLLPAFREREVLLDKKGAFPFENVEDLKKMDYLRLTLPTESGGAGLGLYEFILAQEKIASGCGSTALSVGWTVGTVLEFVESKTWRQPAANYLMDAIAMGGFVNTVASERNAGSPTRGALPTTRYYEEDGKWFITGEKTFSTAAPALTHAIVTATSAGDKLIKIIIPMKAQGVSLIDTWDSLAMRGTASQTIKFDHVEVSPDLIIDEGVAFQSSAKGWLLHIPACYLGIAQAARNYAFDFATTYIPSSLGRPIAEAASIQSILSEMEMHYATARQMLYQTVESYEAATDKNTMQQALDLTKVFVSQQAIQIVDLAMKVVGARALGEANPMHRYFMNIRASLYNPPMADVVQSKLVQKTIHEFYDKNSKNR